MSHTQGKLNFYDDRLSTGRIEIVGIGKTVARIYLSVPGEDEANARRLVACWNFCEGIPTDQLEECNNMTASEIPQMQGMLDMVNALTIRGKQS